MFRMDRKKKNTKNNGCTWNIHICKYTDKYL